MGEEVVAINREARAGLETETPIEPKEEGMGSSTHDSDDEDMEEVS